MSKEGSPIPHENTPRRETRESTNIPLEFDTGISMNTKDPFFRNLIEKIGKNGGHITYTEYMRLSQSKYYEKVKLGDDFITAPEVFPSFGSHVIQPLLKAWINMGRPSEFPILETGGGKGTLARQILDWAKKYKEDPAFYNSIQYEIIEKSDSLIKQQKETIEGGWLSRNDHKGKLKLIPGSGDNLQKLNIKKRNCAIISNEFFDALPPHIVTMIDGELKEKYLLIRNGKLVEGWGEPTSGVESYIARNRYQIAEGVEEPINLDTETSYASAIDTLGEKGIISTIDYGVYGQTGEKGKRAIRLYPRKTDYAKQYANPGDYDLTTDINFVALALQATRAGLHRMYAGTQKDFLYKTGDGIKNDLAKLEKLGKEEGWEPKFRKRFEDINSIANSTDFQVLVVTKGIGNITL